VDGDKVNVREKLARFSDHFAPRTVATLNDYKVQLVKVQGEFVWHSHPETDDFFFVLKGQLEIQLHDRTVVLDEGELFVVPAGVEHCPRARAEAHVLLIEPQGTVNTGDAPAGGLTAVERSI
jgi:mannose-6-phosphate isomerase-like protein (cupin superfamily)